MFNLVVAAALILPNAESQAGGDLRAYYDAHGRWATPFVAAYALLAYPVNWHFAHANPLENPASALIALFALTACFARSRRLLSIVTGLNLAAIGLLLMEMTLSQ